MRPLPPRRSGRRFWAALLCAVALTSCEGDPVKRRVYSIEVGAPSPVLRPGYRMRLEATPFGADGEPVEATIVWQSLSPLLASVDATGQVLAKLPGTAVIRVIVEQVTADISIDLVNPPTALLALPQDSVELFLPNGSLVLLPTVADSDGVPIVGAPLEWSSSASRIVSVGSTGEIVGQAAGLEYVFVEHNGLRDSTLVAVSATGGENTPSILTISPSIVVPGQPVTIDGGLFVVGASNNSVLVDGLPMTVLSASRSQIVAVLPAGAPCGATGGVQMQVSNQHGIGTAPVTLQTAPQRLLEVGEAFLVTSAGAAACNELTLDGGEYLISISHTARALGSGTVSVQMTGHIAPGATTSGVIAEEPLGVAEARAPGAARARDPARERALRAHGELLEDARTAVAQARGRTEGRTGAEAQLQVPPVNGVTAMRVPNIDQPNFCSEYHAIGVRTVYSGPHIAILEDTTAALARNVDATIAALGAEVEALMWPIASRFGNPLVMDDRLDDNDQVVLVLTPRMNTMRGGDLTGLTVTCDFFARTVFAASNVGEMIYLQVPTTADPGFAPGTLEHWRFNIRSVIVHELKHVASFGERIIRSQPLEEIWLEEATARHAEELYAREIYGLEQNGDAMFASSVRCEIREFGTPIGCDDEPRMLRSHLDALWDYLIAPAARSPLGATDAGDVSYYGSAWALTRWAIDQGSTSENNVLSGLTLSGQSGVANLEGRIGLPWEVIVPFWSLAMLTDGGADSVASPQLKFGSWNLSDLFLGLCSTLGPCLGGEASPSRYGRAHPARPLIRPVGEFGITTAPIQPGGFVALRLTGNVSSGRQLLELRGTAGPLPASVRLAIVRVN
jgi:hypothetical protein